MTQAFRSRREILLALGALGLAGYATPGAWAQDRFPNRQLRILVGSLAGSTTDMAARLVATHAAGALGQAVLVDNRPGAGGAIAGRETANARPDGHTLLMGTTSFTTLVSLLQSPPPFNLLADFEPVHVVGYVPLTLFVPYDLPVNSVRELVALARSSPGKLSYASAGQGSASHLTGELFKLMGGNLHIVHIPYRGGPAMDLAVATGQVQMSFDSPGAIGELHNGKKVKALAVLAKTRSDRLPDVPTAAEAGFPELVAMVSFYVLAPARTPAPTLEKLNQVIAQVTANADFKREMARAGFQASPPDTLAGARAHVKEEVGRWSRVISSNNVKVS